MHFDDALKRFTLQLRADGRSSNTLAQYARHLGAFRKWLNADVELEAITPELVATFLSDPRVQLRANGAGKKPTSLNTLRSALRVFFDYATQAGHIAQDPSRLVRRARCATAPPRTVNADDIGKLVATLERAVDRHAPRDQAMIHTLVATGIRVGSLVGLDVGDLDLSAGELALRQTKGNVPQRVVMPPQLRDHLRTFIGRREHGPLFANSKGNALTVRHVQRRLGFWLERAGIVANASPHTLRHSFAMRVYQHTGDVLLVKEALGHRSINSSLVYAHADRRRLRDAIHSLPVESAVRDVEDNTRANTSEHTRD